jgi:hypothetical protein
VAYPCCVGSSRSNKLCLVWGLSLVVGGILPPGDHR